jgi:hypothetical protein
MVAVRRDIDRYADRESKSEAIFRIEGKDDLAPPYRRRGAHANSTG